MPGREFRRALPIVALLACAALSSCAYYNTFYLAKKNYEKGTNGLPYVVDKPDPVNFTHFNNATKLSQKLMANYPKDKLVDDAYLLWARSVIGVDDPRQAVKLLEDFSTSFPKSSLLPDARFYLGVAYRQSRKYANAVRAFDEFLEMAPKHHDLRPYAHLERSRAFMSLERPADAAAAAQEVIEKHPKFKLIDRARLVRAEALLAQGAHEEARRTFYELGNRADNDADRLKYLLREADCLEAARRYDDELALLTDALAHERPPVPADSARGQLVQAGTPGSDAYGQLLIRIGTAELMAGRLGKALSAYQRVIRDFARSPLASEAQYRTGYAYETVADDFEKAKEEYLRVREHGSGGAFVDQAGNRLANLDRLAQFRSAGGDSATKKAEAGFLLAELYLFQLDKPDRALEEYQKIATEFAGQPMGAKAINAQAWVLSRKFHRREGADSLFWTVVREYPKTEAQLAARDYLELGGVFVPEDLIQAPEPLYARADSLRADSLARLPLEPELAVQPPPPSESDSLHFGQRQTSPMMPSPYTGAPGAVPPGGVPPGGMAPPPTAAHPVPPAPAPLPPPAALRDTARTRPAPVDSTKAPPPAEVGAPPAPQDSTRAPK
jgi:tetratricopeptide (TPR) repeat protein